MQNVPALVGVKTSEINSAFLLLALRSGGGIELLLSYPPSAQAGAVEEACFYFSICCSYLLREFSNGAVLLLFCMQGGSFVFLFGRKNKKFWLLERFYDLKISSVRANLFRMARGLQSLSVLPFVLS